MSSEEEVDKEEGKMPEKSPPLVPLALNDSDI